MMIYVGTTTTTYLPVGEKSKCAVLTRRFGDVGVKNPEVDEKTAIRIILYYLIHHRITYLRIRHTRTVIIL